MQEKIQITINLSRRTILLINADMQIESHNKIQFLIIHLANFKNLTKDKYCQK